MSNVLCQSPIIIDHRTALVMVGGPAQERWRIAVGDNGDTTLPCMDAPVIIMQRAWVLLRARNHRNARTNNQSNRSTIAGPQGGCNHNAAVVGMQRNWKERIRCAGERTANKYHMAERSGTNTSISIKCPHKR